MQRKTPYLFLLFLTLIITFLFGVRYGRRVERYDKYFYFLLSLTPSPRKTTKQTLSYSFKFLNFKECKISFVYPEDFKLKKYDKTLKLFQNKNLMLETTCFKQKPKENVKSKKFELKFKGKTLQANEKNSFITFVYHSRINNLFYQFKVNKNIYPLISGSIIFKK